MTDVLINIENLTKEQLATLLNGERAVNQELQNQIREWQRRHARMEAQLDDLIQHLHRYIENRNPKINLQTV